MTPRARMVYAWPDWVCVCCPKFEKMRKNLEKQYSLHSHATRTCKMSTPLPGQRYLRSSNTSQGIVAFGRRKGLVKRDDGVPPPPAAAPRRSRDQKSRPAPGGPARRNLALAHRALQEVEQHLSKLGDNVERRLAAEARDGQEALTIALARLSQQRRTLAATRAEEDRSSKELEGYRAELVQCRRDHRESQERARQLSDTLARVSQKYSDTEAQVTRAKLGLEAVRGGVEALRQSLAGAVAAGGGLRQRELALRAELRGELTKASSNTERKLLTAARSIGARMRQTEHDSRHLNAPSAPVSLDPDVVRPGTSHTQNTQGTRMTHEPVLTAKP